MKRIAMLLWVGVFGSSVADAMGAKDFETTEYYRSGGLNLINASSAYGLGYTGKNVIIALMDTGVYLSHNKFTFKILPGYDMYTDQGFEDDSNGHGTHVSGIMAAHRTGKGMHGVAYDAKIIPIRIFSEDDIEETVTEYDSRMSRAVRYGFEQGARISNNSWGFIQNTDNGYYGTSIKDYTKTELETDYPQQLETLREAVTLHDEIFVFAAGNVYNETQNQQDPSLMGMLPYVFPEFKGHWLTVVNIDKESMMNDSSHYCGDAAEWCLAAPGTNIFSTMPGGHYANMTGTSMSAPHVSGGLAILADAFPSLKSEQLVRRLLVTANKSGHFSDRTLYGQGLMDLKAATQPIGTLQLPVDHKSSGRVRKMPRLKEGVAFKLKTAIGPRPLLVLDSFDRAPFRVNADVLFADLISSHQAEWHHWTQSPVQSNAHQRFQPYFAQNQIYPYSSQEISGFRWSLAHDVKNIGALIGYKKPLKAGYVEWQSGTLLEEGQVLGFSDKTSEPVATYTPTIWQGVQMGWQVNSFHLSGGWQLARTETLGSKEASIQPLVSFDTPLWSQTWQLAVNYQQAAHRWQLAWKQPIQITSGKSHLHWPDSISDDGTIHYKDEWVSLQQASKQTIESTYHYQHTPQWSSQWITSVTLQATEQTQYWTGFKMDYAW